MLGVIGIRFLTSMGYINKKIKILIILLKKMLRIIQLGIIDFI